MSSSNREAIPCDGTLYREDRAIGPLRLPMKNADAFVDQFNRRYGPAGLAIRSETDEDAGTSQSSPGDIS